MHNVSCVIVDEIERYLHIPSDVVFAYYKANGVIIEAKPNTILSPELVDNLLESFEIRIKEEFQNNLFGNYFLYIKIKLCRHVIKRQGITLKSLASRYDLQIADIALELIEKSKINVTQYYKIRLSYFLQFVDSLAEIEVKWRKKEPLIVDSYPKKEKRKIEKVIEEQRLIEMKSTKRFRPKVSFNDCKTVKKISRASKEKNDGSKSIRIINGGHPKS